MIGTRTLEDEVGNMEHSMDKRIWSLE